MISFGARADSRRSGVSLEKHARVLLSKLFRGELCIYATYQAPQDNRPAKVSGIRPLTRRLFKIQVYNPYIP